MNGAQRRRFECQAPGRLDVDKIMGLNPIWKYEWNKKVVQICHNPKGHDTDTDARYTSDDDFPTLSTNCEEAVVWRECD